MAWDGQPKNIVGRAVQKFRIARGWSQPELAAKCQLAGWDVSRGIIAGVEGRMRWVGDYEVMILANVLKVAVDDLYPEGIKEVNWKELGVDHFPAKNS